MKKLTASVLSLIVVFVIALSFTNTAQGEEALNGKDVFLDKKCQQCHSVESEGIEAKIKNKYPDLSTIEGDVDAETLKKYLLKEEKLNGKNHLMKFNGSDEELDAVVNWMLSLGAEE
jgi:cytochrome c5